MVSTIGLGRVWVYPVTVGLIHEVQKQFGNDLGSAPAESLFDAYLTFASATIDHASSEERGLTAEQQERLTGDDKIALATEALRFFSEAAPEAPPIHAFAIVLAKEGAKLRDSELELSNRLKSLVGNDSASLALLKKSQRHSEMIRQALRPLDALSEIRAGMDIIKKAQGPYRDLLDTIKQTTNQLQLDRTPSIDNQTGNLLREIEIGAHQAPADPRTEEHQARLEAAGEQVIELARVVTLRVNELADFAETFQIDAAVSGKRNLKIAIAALISSALLSLAQLGYQVWKDVGDSSKNEEQMALLREARAASTQQVTLMRQMVDDAKRERDALTKALTQKEDIAPRATLSGGKPLASSGAGANSGKDR